MHPFDLLHEGGLVNKRVCKMDGSEICFQVSCHLFFAGNVFDGIANMVRNGRLIRVVRVDGSLQTIWPAVRIGEMSQEIQEMYVADFSDELLSFETLSREKRGL